MRSAPLIFAHRIAAHCADIACQLLVHFQTVTPGRDYGIELEVLNGLKVGEEVAVDPSDAVQEGALVQIAATTSPQEKAP
jgi:hypothetical protein